MNGSSNAATSGIPKSKLRQLKRADFIVENSLPPGNAMPSITENEDGSLNITSRMIVDGSDYWAGAKFLMKRGEFFILRAERIDSVFGMVDWWHRNNDRDYIQITSDGEGSVRGNATFTDAKQAIVMTQACLPDETEKEIHIRFGINEGTTAPGIYGLEVYIGNIKDLCNVANVFKRKVV